MELKHAEELVMVFGKNGPSSVKPQLLDRLTCKLHCRTSVLHCTVNSIQINQYNLSYSLTLYRTFDPSLAKDFSIEGVFFSELLLWF